MKSGVQRSSKHPPSCRLPSPRLQTTWRNPLQQSESEACLLPMYEVSMFVNPPVSQPFLGLIDPLPPLASFLPAFVWRLSKQLFFSFGTTEQIHHHLLAPQQSGEKHALRILGGECGLLLARVPRRPDPPVDEAVQLPQRGHTGHRLEPVSGPQRFPSNIYLYMCRAIVEMPPQ